MNQIGAVASNIPYWLEYRGDHLTPLILFALWAVVLAFVLGVARVFVVIRDKRALNTFRPAGDTEQLDAFSRAYLNALENLPIFTVLYVAALYLVQSQDNATVGSVGWIVLFARIVQSLAHVSSRSNGVTAIRATAQLVQFGCFVWLGAMALYWLNLPVVT